MDVVIPFHTKDSDTLQEVVPRLQQHIVGVKDIYVVGAHDPLITGTMFVHEDVFPFRSVIPMYYSRHTYRTGWIFQQLIKLTAWRYIPTLSEVYLVWDSDTVVYRRLGFTDASRRAFLLGKSYDLHPPYFRHIERMIPCMATRFLPHSAICHHQVFCKRILEGMFSMVEGLHDGVPFELVFLSMLDKNEKACCSEYELYANYITTFHPDEIEFRDLRMISVATFDFQHRFDVDHPDACHVDLISYHKYEDSTED